MSEVIQLMLEQYKAVSIREKKHAIREILQELVLSAFARTDFFNHAAFYGGTALRIFHELDRYSEDLDFSLLVRDDSFSLADYIPLLKEVLTGYGISMELDPKMKTRETTIQSAFLKANTIEQFVIFYGDNQIRGIHPEEKIRIKFEIDVDPPPFASYEYKYRVLPMPYQVQLYDMPSLFAGKLHAVLCRSWLSRIKGRDLYDYVFYLSRNVPVNIKHLHARMVQSGHYSVEDDLTLEALKQLLIERFERIDFELAKRDVIPFVRNTQKIDFWSSDFFAQITDKLEGI